MVALSLLGLIAKAKVREQAPLVEGRQIVGQILPNSAGDLAKDFRAASRVGDDDAEINAGSFTRFKFQIVPDAYDLRAQLLNGGIDFCLYHFASYIAGME